MIPNTTPEQVADLYHRLAEIERRNRNRKRTGTIAEGPNDKGLYRVKISEQGGTPFLTPWIKARTYGAGGVKMDVVYTAGEQVDVVSESGDLTDATVDMSTYSEANARENADNQPFHLKIGSTVIQAGGEGVTITAGTIKLQGDVQITGSGLTHNGKNIGDTHVHGGILVGGQDTSTPH